ncbi:thiamine-phosphate kinase [Microlunatus speluncae]|uniref:thiamine-phosphate kinase n=1 Tax=Microlunatus speluncae TaxID=2594267 RepID=UPI0012662CAB|nr:thiamine-phosphate kinase [Microlunatus speluncae]
MGEVTIAELGEFGLIDLITEGVRDAPEVEVGPGDDAAALQLEPPVIVSTDILVENIHFRPSWSSGSDVGRKAIAVNVADIEAMGGRARAVTVAFSAPADTPVSWVREFAAGLREECAAAGVHLVGGDVTGSRDVTVSVTALGVTDGRDPVRRDGAVPGEVVAVCGRLGWAAAGLVVLGRGFRSPRAVVEAQRVPAVPYGAGADAAESGATAMIDVSDGLLADLGHIARASGVIIDVDTGAFEIAEPLQAVAAATGTDPLRLVLTGGEDHALAATFPDTGAVPEGWLVIGTVRAGDPEVLVDGEPWEESAGWDHFRR